MKKELYNNMIVVDSGAPSNLEPGAQTPEEDGHHHGLGQNSPALAVLFCPTRWLYELIIRGGSTN
jgi:hypothetical protein